MCFPETLKVAASIYPLVYYVTSLLSFLFLFIWLNNIFPKCRFIYLYDFWMDFNVIMSKGKKTECWKQISWVKQWTCVIILREFPSSFVVLVTNWAKRNVKSRKNSPRLKYRLIFRFPFCNSVVLYLNNFKISQD